MTPRTRVLASALGVLLLLSSLAGCAGARKRAAREVTRTDAVEAYKRAVGLLARHQLRQALTALQRIQYTPESLQEIEPLARLATADATFYQGTRLALIDARNLYLDFVTLYGDHPLAAYAQTQAGLCSLRQVNNPSRDQSQTFQAIRDLRVVGDRYPGSTFAEAARGLLREAEVNLAESEFLVGRFYLKRKHYLAAAERFHGVLEHYPGYAELDKVLYHLGRALLAAESETEGRVYLDQLVHDFPDSRWTAEARRALDAAGGPLDDDHASSPH